MDQQLLFLINRTWISPTADWVMAAASSFDLWWPILLVLGVLAVIFGGFRMRAMLLAIGLSIGITDALVVDTIKGMVGRPRPGDTLEGVRSIDLARARPRLLALGQPLQENYSVTRIQAPHGNSFPSGHAANNFAVAAVCAVFFRRWGWLLFIPATLVAYSRVYVGSHWPLDVVVSCLIGAGIGLLTAVILEAAWRRYGANWIPRWHERHPSLLTA